MSKYAFVVGFAAFIGCGGHASKTATPAEQQVGEPPSQVDRGAALYEQSCASCHGADGRGTRDAPALVGEGALPLRPPAGAKRQVEFATAGDVFRWVRIAMPGDAPGSLSDADYAAILAFALQANGVDVTGGDLDEARADQIDLHE